MFFQKILSVVVKSMEESINTMSATRQGSSRILPMMYSKLAAASKGIKYPNNILIPFFFVRSSQQLDHLYFVLNHDEKWKTG